MPTSERLNELIGARERDMVELLGLLHGDLDDRDVPALLERLEHSFEERQVAEEELRAQQGQLEDALLGVSAERSRYRDLFEAAPVGYLVTDAAGMIRDANRAVARLLGDDAQALVGKPLANRVDESQRPAFRGWLTELSAARRARTLELTLVTNASGPVQAIVTVARADDRTADETRLRWVVMPLEAASDAEVGDRPLSVRARLRRRAAVVVAHPSVGFRREFAGVVRRVFEGEVQVVASASQLRECVEVVRQGRVDVVVARIESDEDVEAVRGFGDQVRVVVLGSTDPARIAELFAAGALAVLPDASAPDTVVAPLLAALDGWTTIAESARAELLTPATVRYQLLDQLDDEDIDLLARLVRGTADAELAATFGVSERTIKRRLAELYRKLGVGGRVDAAAVGGAAGLLDASHDPPARPGSA